MKKNSVTYLGILILSFYLTINITAQSKEETISDPWTNYMNPGSVHEFLSKYEGEWNLKIDMAMNDELEDIQAEIQCLITTVYQGRFIKIDQSGLMMGMEYNGTTTLGYNNADKKINLTSYTNMGTGILFLDGYWEDRFKQASLTGKISNPVTNEPTYVRQEIQFIDDNNFTIENYDNTNGEDEKLTIIYKFKRR